MKPILLALALAASLWPQAPASLTGDWEGSLDAGGRTLRLLVHIKADGARLTASLDSIDQGVTGIPVTSVTIEDSDVKLELAALRATYEGKLNAGGSEIAGSWTQGGASLPLVLKRAQTAAKKPDIGLPAPLAGFEDSGTMILYLNEERLGVTHFDWKPDGSVQGSMTVSMAGQTVTRTLKITPDATGRWKSAVLKTPVTEVVVTREGTNVRRTAKEKTTTFETRERMFVYDDVVPVLTSQPIRAYDRSKAGKQTFPLLVLMGTGVEVVIEAREQIERSVQNRDLKLTKYLYGLPGIDLFVTADPDGRVYLIDVPAQKAAFVREGYEALRRLEEPDPLLSNPEHDVKVETSIGVPMRDGLKLATDIYRPVGADQAPVILVRTPYKKEMSELQARYYARRGYVVAIQDCRGRFSSPGVWEPFVNEAKDGYDAIEWLAKQPWSTGKIGMIGGSYVGWVQWWAASQKPPHLVTIIPNVAPPDPFYNVPYEYGVHFMMGAIWWANILESKATADLSGVALSNVMEAKYSKLLRALPVIELDKAVLGKENPYWRKWIQHPANDDYWKPANFLDRLKDVRIPVFHQSGWFDGDGIGTKLNYLAMTRHGHPNQKLVLGPWGHTDTATRRVAGRDFGEGAIVDLQRAYLRWFDRWLKGKQNGIDQEPLVSLFIMGSNMWLHGPSYPLPQTRFEKLYLASGGNANTSKGDGRLVREIAGLGAPSDHYTYDPADPTPDPRMYEESEEHRKKARSSEDRKQEAEAHYEKVTAQRSDILVYQTEPLEKPLTFAGPVSAVLYASSSAKDTDWFMYLVEVDKKGKVLPLGQGKIRARFR
ncbi:MAG: CocE/NonD family hydrolase, partial [Acidobacteria bacterium]|nr:CocE/NonD family hydrolase [Acidobacteriota bacterium]